MGFDLIKGTKSSVAIIPARGGSKRLPGKNVRLLCGIPMIGYTISAARNCPFIQLTVVSTDDPEIRRVSLELGAEVIQRPSELAADTASSESVIDHVLVELAKSNRYFDRLVLLQPTSPLRSSHHLSKCLKEMDELGASSSISVVVPHVDPSRYFSVGDKFMTPLLGKEAFYRPVSVNSKAVFPNGAIYAVDTEAFKDKKSFYVEPSAPFLMTKEDSVDVDTLTDFMTCESIIKYRRENV